MLWPSLIPCTAADAFSFSFALFFFSFILSSFILSLFLFHSNCPARYVCIEYQNSFFRFQVIRKLPKSQLVHSLACWLVGLFLPTGSTTMQWHELFREMPINNQEQMAYFHRYGQWWLLFVGLLLVAVARLTCKCFSCEFILESKSNQNMSGIEIKMIFFLEYFAFFRLLALQKHIQRNFLDCWSWVSDVLSKVIFQMIRSYFLFLFHWLIPRNDSHPICPTQ